MKTKIINTECPDYVIYFTVISAFWVIYIYFVVHTKNMNTNSCFRNDIKHGATTPLCSSSGVTSLVSWNQSDRELVHTPWKLVHAAFQCYDQSYLNFFSRELFINQLAGYHGWNHNIGLQDQLRHRSVTLASLLSF